MIRAFEAAVQQIGSLSADLEAKENELSTAVRRAEAQHKQNTGDLSKRLENAIDEFNRLEGSLGTSQNGIDPDGGPADALRIGERLEELEKQRQRAHDAKFLIQCWMEVSERGSLSSLEDMRRLGGGDGKVRCAHIARQLLRISHRLVPEYGPQINGTNRNGAGPGGPRGAHEHDAREIIERFLESLETDLLNQFDEHYRRQNFHGMRESAMALKDFNDGASVMALFVNQHQFFIDRDQLVVAEETTDDGDIWDRIADPDTEPPGIDAGLQSLIDEVRLVVQEESFIIKQAFPYPEEVLARFLQRVFQQSIQQRLEVVLAKAEAISTLAFLRALQASRAYISTLVDDLKAHGLTEHPEPPTSQIIATLDQQLEELFVPYFVGTSYIEREKKNLEELYSSLLFKFTTYHSRRKKTSSTTSYLDRLGQRGRELISNARDAYTERLNSADLSASQKAMLLRIAGLKDTDANRREAEIEVTEQDGALNVQVAKRMLKWLAEAVGRGLELANTGSTSSTVATTSSVDTSRDVQTLLSLLLTHMGEIYLDSALDTFSEAAAVQENSKQEPEFSYLSALHPAIQILHLLQMSVQTLLVPLRDGSAGPSGQSNAMTAAHRRRGDIDRAAANTINSLETKMSTILHRTLDASLLWTSKLLTNLQKKTDFRPPPNDLTALEALQTPACAAIFTFLSTKVEKPASMSLDGFNRRMLLSELASGLRSLLLDHLRKFTVSLTGGLVMRKDVTKYVDLVRSWGLTSSTTAGSTNYRSSSSAQTSISQAGSSQPGKSNGPAKEDSSPAALTPFELEGGMEILIEVANLFVIGPDALKERLSTVKAAAAARASGMDGGGSKTPDEVAELKKYIERREDVNSVGVQAVLNSV